MQTLLKLARASLHRKANTWRALKFDTEHVRVSVSSGSVVVTTEIPVDDGMKAEDVELQVTSLSHDAEGLNTLYGAPSVIDQIDVIDVHTADDGAHTPLPPSAPPPAEEEDPTARAVIAVFLSLAVVVTALIIVYCVSFDGKKKAADASKAYPAVAYVGASFEAPTSATVQFRL